MSLDFKGLVIGERSLSLLGGRTREILRRKTLGRVKLSA